MNSLCPNDKAPVSCSCSAEESESITAPFDDPLVVVDCLPEKCQCDDGSEIDVQNKRKKKFDKFANLCGKCVNFLLIFH